MLRTQNPTASRQLNLRAIGPRIAIYAFLVLWAIIMGFPLFWMLSTALKTESAAIQFPPQLIPDPIVWRNFYDSMTSANFDRYFFNSAFVSLSVVAFTLIFSSSAGYAFGRMSFPGRNILFVTILATMMVPPQVTMIPVFTMIVRFPLVGGNDLMGQGGSGLLDTYPALILPGISTAFGIFMMRQFMMKLPIELEDAARVDGASEFQIFWNIMLPLVKPALVTLGLLSFATTWNDFIWPLIVTNSEDMRTVQLGLATFRGIHFTDHTLFMAGTTIAILPVLLIFLIGQRFFVRAVTMSGLKG